MTIMPMMIVCKLLTICWQQCANGLGHLYACLLVLREWKGVSYTIALQPLTWIVDAFRSGLCFDAAGALVWLYYPCVTVKVGIYWCGGIYSHCTMHNMFCFMFFHALLCATLGRLWSLLGVWLSGSF